MIKEQLKRCQDSDKIDSELFSTNLTKKINNSRVVGKANSSLASLP